MQTVEQNNLSQTMSFNGINPKIDQFIDQKMKSFKMDNQSGASVLETLN
jgi:hypothetical protein